MRARWSKALRRSRQRSSSLLATCSANMMLTVRGDDVEPIDATSCDKLDAVCGKQSIMQMSFQCWFSVVNLLRNDFIRRGTSYPRISCRNSYPLPRKRRDFKQRWWVATSTVVRLANMSLATDQPNAN